MTDELKQEQKPKWWAFEDTTFLATSREEARQAAESFLAGPSGVVTASTRKVGLDEITEYIPKPIVPPTAAELQKTREFNDLMEMDTALTIRFEDLERMEPGAEADTEQAKLQVARQELSVSWDAFFKRWPKV